MQTTDTDKLKSEYRDFMEIMSLVARYDWAVEGGERPDDQYVTRDEAAQLRKKLLGLLS